MQDASLATTWPLAARVAFRFACVYFVVSFFSAILQLVPLLGMVGAWHDEAVKPFYVWIGRAVFGVEITVFPNGSGDTTYNWVLFASHLAFALVATAVWSAVDPRRPSYPWLKDGLWIAMRFTLASAMFGYGINKIFGLQFPEPGMQRLLQDYGDSSPMGLMWTFMGASLPYTMFAGWMEAIGGLTRAACGRRGRRAAPGSGHARAQGPRRAPRVHAHVRGEVGPVEGARRGTAAVPGARHHRRRRRHRAVQDGRAPGLRPGGGGKPGGAWLGDGRRSEALNWAEFQPPFRTCPPDAMKACAVASVRYFHFPGPLQGISATGSALVPLYRISA